ncbi:MAG: hypothetical protein COU31_00400 [Candidatus Magasanikbacteria bacterium CG10_big_fil_rev_8_21_14_0_10_40_10]|uniref:Uncharacterized protein n=1 Tax=Candidatus Magasanikbacteria bacterium CG10_big_fil_rev_8_21_14_0_10_40_10 TaxID=1974648 RepID=A0A2M6W573_9BACT|nr:MAG: hypothetical protein COU31_00400 [Candidatus Magasanikbacteria bacterium CG10_big_fil_rev_8_21_14_0_10_40_10]
MGGYYLWFLGKLPQIKAGTAEYRFPYQALFGEQLNFLAVNEYMTGIKDTQTPEQTYNLLRIYLKNKDITEALELFAPKYHISYEQIFKQAREERALDLSVGQLEKEIIPIQTDCVSRCSYEMKNSHRQIDFIKNMAGVWLIESL